MKVHIKLKSQKEKGWLLCLPLNPNSLGSSHTVVTTIFLHMQQYWSVSGNEADMRHISINLRAFNHYRANINVLILTYLIIISLLIVIYFIFYFMLLIDVFEKCLHLDTNYFTYRVVTRRLL
jgi:hypothetical protein